MHVVRIGIGHVVSFVAGILVGACALYVWHVDQMHQFVAEIAPSVIGLATAPIDQTPQPQIPASGAHDPTISLARFISVTGTGKRVREDPQGYWNVMVAAHSSADASIDTVLLDCTAYGANNEPLADGHASFTNLQPGQTTWAKATFHVEEQPLSIQCHPGVAYNLH